MITNRAFGRRHSEASGSQPGQDESTGSLQPSQSSAELRALCLARLEPAAIAALPPERLTIEVERLIAEIATERRLHVNAREQRTMAGELVNDMLGLGPLEPLLEDDSIADIMVNGPNRVFVERRGKLELSGTRFRDSS